MNLQDDYADLVNYIASAVPQEIDWVQTVQDFLNLTSDQQRMWVECMILHSEAYKVCCRVTDDGKVLPQHVKQLEEIKRKLPR